MNCLGISISQLHWTKNKKILLKFLDNVFKII